MSVNSLSSEALNELIQQATGVSSNVKLESFGFFLADYIIQGGVVTVDAVNKHKFSVTSMIASLSDGLWQVDDKDFIVRERSKTLFLDFTVENGFVLNVVHPSDTYLPLWEINTNSSANITSIVDMRGTMGYVKFTDAVSGLSIAYADQAGSTAFCDEAGHAISADTAVLANTATSATNVPFTGITGKPTTLTGFGITDATPSSHIGAGGSAHADVVSGGLSGFMNGFDKTKLDGIEANANNYTHPVSHPPSIITQDANNRFVSDSEKSTWNGKADTSIATTSVNGLMSSTDKTKLNGVASGAEVNQNAFSSVKVTGQPDVISTDKQDALSVAGGTGITVTTNAVSRTMTITATGVSTPGAHGSSHIGGGSDPIPDATANGHSGLLSASDKAKLDGVEAGANNYVLPSALAPSIITQNTTNRFVTDAEKTSWNNNVTATATKAASGGSTKSMQDMEILILMGAM